MRAFSGRVKWSASVSGRDMDPVHNLHLQYQLQACLISKQLLTAQIWPWPDEKSRGSSWYVSACGIWTNTFYNLDKYILKFGQIHLTIREDPLDMYQRAASGPSSSLCVSSSSRPISTQAIIVQAYLGLSLLIQPFLRVYENFHLHPSWQRFAWPSSRNPLVRPEVLSTNYMKGTQCHSRSKTLAQGTQVTLVTRPWLRDELLEEVLKLQLPFWGEFSEMSQLGIYIHLSWSCLWFFIRVCSCWKTISREWFSLTNLYDIY